MAKIKNSGEFAGMNAAKAGKSRKPAAGQKKLPFSVNKKPSKKANRSTDFN